MERMERLYRRLKDFLSEPRRVLLLAFATGVVSMLLYAAFSLDIYRDVAACYAYMAREFGRGDWSESFHPRLPPLNIALAGCLCLLKVEAYTATILVSGTFFCLTILPLYALLKRFLSPTQAAWGAMLYILAPKMIRFAGTGLLESARNFFLVAALLFLCRLVDRRRLTDGVWFGLMLGGLSLSRSEGLAVAAVLLAALPAVVLLRRKQQSVNFARTVAVTATAAGVFILTLVPISWLNYRTTGYPAPDLRLVEMFAPEVRQAGGLPPAMPREKSLAAETLDIFSDLSRGAYEVYLGLGALGLFLILKRRQWRWEYTLFAVLIALHCLIYLAVTSAYRYHTYAIMLLMVFTVTGLWSILELAERYGRWRFLLIPIGAALILLQLQNGLQLAFQRKDDAIRETARFLRAGHPDRRLRLAAVELPELTFWSDAIALNGYTRRVRDWETVGDFDFIALRPRNKAELEILTARPDLEAVDHPNAAKIFLFRKRPATAR